MTVWKLIAIKATAMIAIVFLAHYTSKKKA